MICKHFLPFGKLCFHCVDSFLCCAKAFLFDIVAPVYFCFRCLCFWCQIKIIITSTDIEALTACVYLEFLWFRISCSNSLIHFELILMQGLRYWSSFILLHIAIHALTCQSRWEEHPSLWYEGWRWCGVLLRIRNHAKTYQLSGHRKVGST